VYLCIGDHEFVQNVLKVCGCYSAEMLLELMSSLKCIFGYRKEVYPFGKCYFRHPPKC